MRTLVWENETVRWKVGRFKTRIEARGKVFLVNSCMLAGAHADDEYRVTPKMITRYLDRHAPPHPVAHNSG